MLSISTKENSYQLITADALFMSNFTLRIIVDSAALWTFFFFSNKTDLNNGLHMHRLYSVGKVCL